MEQTKNNTIRPQLKDLRNKKVTKHASKKIRIILLLLLFVVFVISYRYITVSIPTDKPTEVGMNIEEKYSLKLNKTIKIDYLNDYRFENIASDIIDIYATSSSDSATVQDIFIIKSNNPKKIYNHFKDYRDSIINSTIKNKNTEIYKHSILKTKGKCVYFIAAKNCIDIEKVLLRTTKM